MVVIIQYPVIVNNKLKKKGEGKLFWAGDLEPFVVCEIFSNRGMPAVASLPNSSISFQDNVLPYSVIRGKDFEEAVKYLKRARLVGL